MVLASSTLLASCYAFYRIYNKYISRTKHVLIGYVCELSTFPVKGMRGVTSNSCKLTNLGLFIDSKEGVHDSLDRGFMVVNMANKTMVNAKQHFKLITVCVRPIAWNKVQLSAAGFGNIVIEPMNDGTIRSRVHVTHANPFEFIHFTAKYRLVTEILKHTVRQKT